MTYLLKVPYGTRLSVRGIVGYKMNKRSLAPDEAREILAQGKKIISADTDGGKASCSVKPSDKLVAVETTNLKSTGNKKRDLWDETAEDLMKQIGGLAELLGLKKEERAKVRITLITFEKVNF